MRRHLLLGLQIIAALIGVFLLYRVFGQHDAREIAAAIGRIPAWNIALAALCTVGSYACLTANEYLGVAYATSKNLTGKQRASPWRILAVAVAAIGIGHSLGMAALSSGAVRYRMYGRIGLDVKVTARVLLFSGLTVLVSLLATLAVIMIWDAPALDRFLPLAATTQYGIAALLFAGIGVYIGLCARGAEIKIGPLRLGTPPPMFAVAQLVLGVTNFAFIGGALYAVLAPIGKATLPLATALIVMTDAAALIIHVPGGWGVLEYIVHSVLGGTRVMAAVLVFRAVYYLAPMVIGVAVLLADECTALRWRGLPKRVLG